MTTYSIDISDIKEKAMHLAAEAAELSPEEYPQMVINSASESWAKQFELTDEQLAYHEAKVLEIKERRK